MSRMHAPGWLSVLVLVWGLWSLGELGAQRPGPRRRPPARSSKKEPPPPRPTDPRLVEIFREFLAKAEKLGAQYEKQRKWDQALEVYESILRLLPKYPPAVEAVRRIRAQMATAKRVQVTIRADQGWQDTGVILQPGKPVTILARGSWVVRMQHQVGPDGIAIPKELRDFNLGALVGIVASKDPKKQKPFLVGSRLSFVPREPGRLFLRMYDSNPADNEGSLTVVIQGSFETAR